MRSPPLPPLDALVATLTTSPLGLARAVADLIQLDDDAAAVALRPGGEMLFLLVHDAARGSPEALEARLAHVLRSERPEVIAGLSPGSVHAVLVGAAGEELAGAPGRSAGYDRAITWYAVTHEGAIVTSTASPMQALLEWMVATARDTRVAKADLVAVERAGEGRVGEVGAERLFAKAGRSLKKAPATFGLGGVLILVFLLEVAWGGSQYGPTYRRMGGMVPARVLAGDWWGLLTAGYLHGGFMHLVGNLQMLLLCYYAELVLGSSRFVVLFTLSVLGGNVLSLVTGNKLTLYLGASGGIFGLAVALFVLTLRDHRFLPGVTAGSLRKTFALVLGRNFFLSFAPGVSLSGHAGGALGGAALVFSGGITWGLTREWLGEAPRASAVGFFRAAAAACMAVTVLSLGVAWGKGRPWNAGPSGAVHRVAFSPLPISMELPDELTALPHRSATGEVSVGMNGDPISVGVVVLDSLGAPVADSQLDDATEKLKEARKRAGPPKDVRWRQPPSVVQLGGRKAVYLSQYRPRGSGAADLVAPRWVFIVGDRIVDVEVVIAPGGPAAWNAVPSRVMESFRIDGPFPPPPPPEWSAVATVTALEGTLPVRPGGTCDVSMTRHDDPSRKRPCRWRITCGGALVYGSGTSGWAPCSDRSWAPGVRVSDPETTSKDGDPSLLIDTTRGVLELGDDLNGAHGRIHLVASLEGAP